MEYWHQYLQRRIDGEEPDVPWFLHDKLECARFCQTHSLPVVNILRDFETPAEINLSGLPLEFVLKPTQLHSAQGVMVLSEHPEGFHEAFLDEVLTEDEIRHRQQEFFNRPELNQKHLSGNRLIVEEKVIDADGYEIPRDFKVYAFSGRAELILVIDRNTQPHTVQWFDRNLAPIGDDRITYNPRKVIAGDTDLSEMGPEIVQVGEAASRAVPTPFCRIDLYRSVQGLVIGEITLTPGGLYVGQSYTLSRPYERELAQRWSDAEKALDY